MNKMYPSDLEQGKIGLCGHAGISHAYSQSGLMAEDSGGFAILIVLLQKAVPFSIEIKSVKVIDGDTVCVQTLDNGLGYAKASSGFNAFEEELMQKAVGLSCAAPQTLAAKIYGRIYGQGATEQASVFCLAVAKAYLDTIRKKYPCKFYSADEELPGSCGEFLGGVITFDDLPISWLISVNAALWGAGPNEDAEGTVPIGNKGRIMQKLGMDKVPLITLEGKVYSPLITQDIPEKCVYIRWNSEYDNPIVGSALVEASKELKIPFLMSDQAFPRKDNGLKNAAKKTCDQIIDYANQYINADTSAQKVDLARKLVYLTNRDLGGTMFMSEEIYNIAGTGGLWPGQSAMLAFIATEAFANKWKTLVFNEEDLEDGVQISLLTCKIIAEKYDQALTYITNRRPNYSPDEILQLLNYPFNVQ